MEKNTAKLERRGVLEGVRISDTELAELERRPKTGEGGSHGANWGKAAPGLSVRSVLEEQEGGQCGRSRRAKGVTLGARLGGGDANHWSCRGFSGL